MKQRIPQKMVNKAVEAMNEYFDSHPSTGMSSSVISPEFFIKKNVCKKEMLPLLLDRLKDKGLIDIEPELTGQKYITRTEICKFYAENKAETKAKDRFSRAMSFIAIVISVLALGWEIVSHIWFS